MGEDGAMGVGHPVIAAVLAAVHFWPAPSLGSEEGRPLVLAAGTSPAQFTPPAAFDCELPEGRLHLGSSRTGTWTGANGATSTVNLGAGYALWRLWCGAAGGDLLLVYEEGGTVDHWSVVERVGKWRVPLPSDEPGPPLIHGDSVFVSSLGLVARLRLTDGSAVWRHDGLIRPNPEPTCCGSLLPRIEGKTVAFPFATSEGALVLDVATGRILAGKPQPFRPKTTECGGAK